MCCSRHRHQCLIHIDHRHLHIQVLAGHLAAIREHPALILNLQRYNDCCALYSVYCVIKSILCLVFFYEKCCHAQNVLNYTRSKAPFSVLVIQIRNRRYKYGAIVKWVEMV